MSRRMARWHFFHLSLPFLRQAVSGREIEVNPVGIEQQDRSDRPAPLLLYNKTENMQYFPELHAGGNHFEEPFLSCMQRFTALAIINIREDSIPSDDLAVLIAQRHGSNQKPPIFAICAAMPHFVLERLTAFERCPPALHVQLKIITVNGGLPTAAGRVFERQPRIILPPPAHKLRVSVGPGCKRHGRYCLDQLAQLRLLRGNRFGTSLIELDHGGPRGVRVPRASETNPSTPVMRNCKTRCDNLGSDCDEFPKAYDRRTIKKSSAQQP